MVFYRHGSDVDLIWEHGKTTLKEISGLQKCFQGILTRGFYNTVHRRTPFADRPPKMHLAFKLAGAHEMQAMQELLKDIPHAMNDKGGRRVWVDVEGAYNIDRSIKALFNAGDKDASFLTRDMHDALIHEHDGFCLTERYYTPSS